MRRTELTGPAGRCRAGAYAGLPGGLAARMLSGVLAAAILVGGGLWGIWGMLLGVPLATIFYQLLRQDVRSREARLPPGE